MINRITVQQEHFSLMCFIPQRSSVQILLQLSYSKLYFVVQAASRDVICRYFTRMTVDVSAVLGW
jgi:hypothetical protein